MWGDISSHPHIAVLNIITASNTASTPAMIGTIPSSPIAACDHRFTLPHLMLHIVMQMMAAANMINNTIPRVSGGPPRQTAGSGHVGGIIPSPPAAPTHHLRIERDAVI